MLKEASPIKIKRTCSVNANIIVYNVIVILDHSILVLWSHNLIFVLLLHYVVSKCPICLLIQLIGWFWRFQVRSLLALLMCRSCSIQTELAAPKTVPFYVLNAVHISSLDILSHFNSDPFHLKHMYLNKLHQNIKPKAIADAMW